MIGVPEFVFYVTATALIAVCLFLVALLYSAIKFLVALRRLTLKIEKEGENVKARFSPIIEVIGNFADMIRGLKLFGIFGGGRRQSIKKKLPVKFY